MGADGAVVGRVLRRRADLAAQVRTAAEPDGAVLRLTVTVTNDHPAAVATRQEAVACSLLGAHLLVEAHDAAFVSLLDPVPTAAAAATRCRQDRCWPVLAGPPGSADLLLGAPIILYDHPQVAQESPGALFDSTEIDEILTLRVMTMTDAEKAEARATDPRARTIVDRCDAMSAADLQRLHGARRDPDPAPPWSGPSPAPQWRDPDPAPLWSDPDPAQPWSDPDPAQPWSDPDPAPPWGDADPAAPWSEPDPAAPWWDPAADAAVDPASDAVLVAGVRVARDSVVRLRPSRRADAQDLFLAGRLARVTAVVSDVDGATHVAVVLVDDPAADLHDWYGRYYYFGPEELEPLTAEADLPRRAGS